jgi:LPS-assembly lipoprotein
MNASGAIPDRFASAARGWGEHRLLAPARIVLAGVLLALSACGFHLRGAVVLPFDTIVIESRAVIANELARAIEVGSSTRVRRDAPTADETGPAPAVFELLSEGQEKAILSLNTSGRPREYQLRYRVGFRVHDGRGGEYIAPITLILRRDLPFNDQLLATQSEEALLYRDMRGDLVQQILRRLQASRLRPRED